ncbi:hypothetical protein ACRAWF_24265 [Streptomyces sp. L7]
MKGRTHDHRVRAAEGAARGTGSPALAGGPGTRPAVGRGGCLGRPLVGGHRLRGRGRGLADRGRTARRAAVRVRVCRAGGPDGPGAAA